MTQCKFPQLILGGTFTMFNRATATILVVEQIRVPTCEEHLVLLLKMFHAGLFPGPEKSFPPTT